MMAEPVQSRNFKQEEGKMRMRIACLIAVLCSFGCLHQYFVVSSWEHGK